MADAAWHDEPEVGDRLQPTSTANPSARLEVERVTPSHVRLKPTEAWASPRWVLRKQLRRQFTLVSRKADR